MFQGLCQAEQLGREWKRIPTTAEAETEATLVRQPLIVSFSEKKSDPVFGVFLGERSCRRWCAASAAEACTSQIQAQGHRGFQGVPGVISSRGRGEAANLGLGEGAQIWILSRRAEANQRSLKRGFPPERSFRCQVFRIRAPPHFRVETLWDEVGVVQVYAFGVGHRGM